MKTHNGKLAKVFIGHETGPGGEIQMTFMKSIKTLLDLSFAKILREWKTDAERWVLNR